MLIAEPPFSPGPSSNNMSQYTNGSQGAGDRKELQALLLALPLEHVLAWMLAHPSWSTWIAHHCIHCGRFNKCARTGRQRIFSEHSHVSSVSLHHTQQLYQTWLRDVCHSPCPYCQ